MLSYTRAPDVWINSAIAGDVKKLRGYLDLHNIDVDTTDAPTYGRTALMFAAENGHLPAVDFLISKGANIHHTIFDGSGWSVLSLTSAKGRYEVVKRLLELGAEVEPKYTKGRTPLICAAEKGHARVIELLAAHGPNIEATMFHDGYTPLINAARHGHYDAVKTLLSLGANIEARSTDGQKMTPLLFASWIGRDRVVKLLIENGANKEAVSGDGRSSLMIVKEFAGIPEYDRVIEILK